jgi:ABC-type bacteriocin/lantibiotic exporter with double-glycine peptidase domain
MDSDTEMALQSVTPTLCTTRNVPPPTSREVELKDLSFTYPGRIEPILKNIQYVFNPNSNYCITGNNGSGKSTLIHLISGLYQPQMGNVCINDLPIGNFNIPELYKKIGNGLNEETIFEGSFYENITLGRDFIREEDIFWAMDQLCLTEHIKTLPNGLDTKIDISGYKLSKSITQKLIIARSIVNKPKLLLLENHLDSIEDKERQRIIDFLTDKKNEWTLIAISNDPYLKKQCDSVIQMEAGALILS